MFKPYFDTEIPDVRFIELLAAYKAQGKSKDWIIDQINYLKVDVIALHNEYWAHVEMADVMAELEEQNAY